MTTYLPDSCYEYINNFNGNIASLLERKAAIRAYQMDLELRLIDVGMDQYLEKIFDETRLVPIFSCSGHESGKQGNILFRSMFDIDKTLSIFKDVILKYYDSVDLKVHYWNANSIGYDFQFKFEDMDEILNYLLKSSSTII